MTTKEIAEHIVKMGKQNITINNNLHRELSALSDYELSEVTIMVEEQGLHLVLDIFSDTYEVY